ncbi:hypothetical protein GWI33_022531 [Rhynchophorus ferrugineus]|uniref:DUF4789 domain-containing protein n=1 Tax=Rhynchophorus ferrugineus TaxID=354439 RepID=A0A834HPR2_RHYFE|nr:hypothetical protein GWI33_022535 [Rhynchophorus ferrugineus]KAF7264727.1 hypothetical protein GWI33_022531 [Rhynchophorus ferrugineus]
MLLELWLIPAVYSAVAPPPWANPDLNPCVRQSRGWQVLFWPPDKKCYKIFKVGYPCPDGMELSPATSRTGKELYAECRCPPGHAFSVDKGKCYQLYTVGPCQEGFYFGPDGEYRNNITTSIQLLGSCKEILSCPDSNSIYWMQDGKCYQKLTRGPCSKGQLLTVSQNRLSVCECDKRKELRQFRAYDGRCYQHFTKGPCKEKGVLFLPDGTCGCHSFLPHYHNETDMCFELGTAGPCSKGEIYTVLPQTNTGGCVCKPGNLRYRSNQSCHRPFTKGPCDEGHILINDTHCIPQPCQRGELYFPDDATCYKIGSRGPCLPGRIISFDFDTRPSVDGVSYNAVCMCETKNCYLENMDEEEGEERPQDIVCDENKGLLRFGEDCYEAFTQGPCEDGTLLVPRKQQDSEQYVGACECTESTAKDEIRIVECLNRVYNDSQIA